MSLDDTRKYTPSPKHARDLSGLAGFDDVDTAKTNTRSAGDDLTVISPVTGAEAASGQSADGQNGQKKRDFKPWVVPVAILAVLAAVYGGGAEGVQVRPLPPQHDRRRR